MLPCPNRVQRAQKPFKDTASLRIEVNGGIGCAEKAHPGNFEAMRDFREGRLSIPNRPRGLVLITRVMFRNFPERRLAGQA